MHKKAMQIAASAPTVARATVIEARRGEFRVRMESGDTISCDVLSGATPTGGFESDDEVLVALPSEPHGTGCVLGLVERYRPDADREESREEHRISAESIVLEAGTRLELKVGDSTVEITEDGKILIRARDVLSRARRMNRIKGGAVSIN